MPKLTIDGREIEVAEGTTILEAALSRGHEIPHYCYHPGLSIAGNCRMCLVEVEKAPKLVIACYTPVADGMVVHTDNEKVDRARAAVQEFLLINHPLDCPICDQAGECRLQEYAVEHGTGVSRYTEPKLALAKAVDIGPHVMLDQERCIQCSRCIRFCDEVTGTSELAFFQRGSRSQIGIVPGKRLDNAYSGNVVDICPVGALTLKEFRFKTRVWYLKNTPSICAGCSRGCNIVVGVGKQRDLMTTQGQLDERIKRVVPRVNEEVNGHWMCDEGRLGHQRLYTGQRLATAEGPADTVLEWDDAVRRAAELISAAAGGRKLGVLVSPRLTSEEMLAWRKLVESLGGGRVGVQRLLRGEDDEILIRADKGANSRGAAWVFGADADEAGLHQAIERGEIDTLLVLGDPLDPDGTPVVDKPLRSKVANVVFVGPFRAGVAETAAVLLPCAAWSESGGTMVNFEGRVQRLMRSHLPHGEGRPGWRVALDVAEAAGAELPAWSAAADVLQSLAGEVEGYAGLDEETIGLLGVRPAAGAVA